MILTEVCIVLLGAKLHIHTDYLNLTTTKQCLIELYLVKILNNSIYTFVSFQIKKMLLLRAKTNMLPSPSHASIDLMSLFFFKGRVNIKDSFSKCMDFAKNPLIFSGSSACHLPAFQVHETNLTGSLLKKLKEVEYN